MILVISFLGAITPGPDVLLIVRVVLKNNIKEAFKTMLGIISGCIIYLSILYFGLSNIIKGDIAQALICIFGGGYMLYLAYKLFKENIETLDLKSSFTSGYKTGLIVNLSNPKAILFFTALVSAYIDNNLLSKLVLIPIGSLFGFLFVIFIASFFKRFINAKLFNVIDKICGVLFILFSISLFINAINKLDGILY